MHPIKTQEEIDALKEYFAKRSKRDLLLFVIGINSGLRISDILRLRVKDVLDDEYNIRRSCEIREKKTGKLKQFALNKKIREILEEYFEADADYKINEENFLFTSRKGINKPITRYHAWRILSGAAKEVGIKERIGTHTLRKTFGYHAHKSGVNIALLQKIFNHTNSQETLRYIGIEQEDIDDVYNNINL